MPIQHPDDTSAENVSESTSSGYLFSREHHEELEKALVNKVARGLHVPHRIVEADIWLVVRELVEEAAQGPFKRLHIERNDDGSFRAFCAGCQVPLCCIVFETIRLTNEDVWTLSKRLAMSKGAFLSIYCDQYSDNASAEFAYKLKSAMPCGFLSENLCTIYTDRPERCRHFPLQRADTGQTFVIYPWCNYLFNLLWHEATLRVLELILQKDRLSTACIRYGGAIGSGTFDCKLYEKMK